MSFFSKLKHALGFGDEQPDELLSDTEDDTVVTPASPSSENNQTPTAETPAADGDDKFSPLMRSRIFDHVVAVFNGAMPDFIRNSVNTNAQSEYIYNTLDESIKQYFDSYESNLRQRLERSHDRRDRELSTEIERMRVEFKKIDEERSAIKERQLSADRQKRALNDRVHELEQQLASLDAEREQLELENKSMLNKLKVARIQGSDEQLQQKCSELELKAEQLSEINDNLLQENNRLHEAMDKQADMHAMSEAMMGDMRQSVAKTREELNERTAQYEAAQRDLEQTRARLAEAEALVSDARAVNDQLAVLVSELDKRDTRISRLKTERAELRRQLDAARALPAFTDAEQAPYGNDISASEAVPETGPEELAASEAQTAEAKPVLPKPGPARPLITDEALDDVEQQFDTVAWSTDSQETSKPTTDKDNVRQSRRKHTPADDAQLSLF